MVNPGHASNGCTTCKLRKIQCDLTHPLCRHCTKSGRVCLGYGERQTKGRKLLHGSAMTAANRQTSLSYLSLTSEDCDGSRQIETSITAASFLEMLFVTTNESKPDNSQSGHSFYTTAAAQGSNKVAVSVLGIIRKCLHSLRQPLQYLAGLWRMRISAKFFHIRIRHPPF
ncbi:hypothetical protein V1517DRAFT_326206 [Lipomyces orientalis]|uniref:Uncharacterized protein n=1 Tax=Lipomyces orientalis TaxID=1233043 RepID=A0ACC3TKS2_9ASCO